MTAHSATNWAMAAIIAACMSTAYLLDSPAQPQPRAQAAQAEHEQTQRQARFERAARKVCGEGRFDLLEDGVIQCLTQHGVGVITAKVAL